MFRSILMLLSLAVVSTQGHLAADPSAKTDEDADAVTVKIIGRLRTGVVAIGGETTGTDVLSKNTTWQLEFAENSKLREAAEKLNGKRVTVEGSLEFREGVETKGRWIISVTKLQPLARDRAKSTTPR